MKYLLAIALGACGSTPKRDTPPPPPPATSEDAGAAPADPVETPKAQGPYGESGPACMPAGRYTASWDLSAAQFSQPGKTVVSDCRTLAEAVPAQTMHTMYVDFDNGNVVIHWPGLVDVKATSECAFEITAMSTHVSLVFADAKATGTAKYTIGTPNHPDENCSVDKVNVKLERAKF